MKVPLLILYIIERLSNAVLMLSIDDGISLLATEE